MSIRLSASANGTRNVNVTRDFVADFSGVGDDSTNNTTPLNDFKTFGLAQSLPVVLTVPDGTYRVSSNAAQFFAQGIANYEMRGVNATTSKFKLLSPAAPLFLAGLGQGGTSYTVASDLNPGDTFLTLTPASDAGDLSPGNKIAVTSLALQGTKGSNFGFPANPQNFDYVTVTASDSGTGRVDFTPALEDAHKTTYPLIHEAIGGPASVFPLHSSWDCDVTIRDIGFSYDVSDINTYATGRNINHYDCAWNPSVHGPCPSQNLTTSFVRSDLSDCVIEVDKIIGTLTYDDCPIQQLWLQSSSIKSLVVRNCDTIAYLDGTPRTAIIEDNVITLMQLGPTSYGCAESAVVNRNVISEWSQGSYTDLLITQNLLMSSGLISCVAQLAVTGFADNGSGKVRLTVSDTTDLATGMTMSGQGLFVTGAQNIAYAVTVVDGTHVDLLTRNFSGATWTGAGYLAAQALRWAIPGRWINMKGTSGVYGNFRVGDVYESGNYWYVETNLAGGWPTGVTSISPHPCEDYTGTGNTGCPEALEHSMAYAQGKPTFSYVNRTYDETLATNNTIQPTVWGLMTDTAAMSINVTTAYTGVPALTWRPTQFANQVRVLRSGTVTTMDLTINAKITGNRVYNGATQTWSGGQSGDTLPAFQTGDLLIGTNVSAPCLSASVSGQGLGPVITYEIKADQGI